MSKPKSSIDRQIIHPRRNGNFTAPRVHFNIPSSPSPNPLDLSINTIQITSVPVQTISEQKTPNISWNLIGSTPSSE